MKIPAPLKSAVRMFFSKKDCVVMAEKLKPHALPLAIDKLDELTKQYAGQYDPETEKMCYMLTVRGKKVFSIPYVVTIGDEKPVRRLAPADLGHMFNEIDAEKHIGKIYDELLK
jgi:hypothetical protein